MIDRLMEIHWILVWVIVICAIISILCARRASVVINPRRKWWFELFMRLTGGLGLFALAILFWVWIGRLMAWVIFG